MRRSPDPAHLVDAPEEARPARAAGRAAVVRLPAAVAGAVAGVFGAVARLRRDRSLHPRGALLRGTARVHPAGAGLLDPRRTGEVVDVYVRLSRGIGLPHPLPDFNGVALRLLDAHGEGRHQDLLLTSSPAPPLLRHVLVPSPSFARIGFSTVLPVRDRAGRRLLFRVPPLAVRRLTELDEALPLVLTVLVASPLGAWEPAATVTLDSTVPSDHVRFDPWRTGPSLVPSGLLNRLRKPAYSASRADAPVDDPAPSTPGTTGPG